MKKGIKYSLLGIVILLILIIVFIFNLKKNTIINDDIVYKPRFVTSLEDINPQIPTVLFFKQANCKECIKMEIVYKEITDIYSGKFNLVYYDTIDFSNREIVNNIEKYDIHNVPTSIILSEDESLIKKVEGIATNDEIINYLIELGMER